MTVIMICLQMMKENQISKSPQIRMQVQLMNLKKNNFCQSKLTFQSSIRNFGPLKEERIPELSQSLCGLRFSALSKEVSHLINTIIGITMHFQVRFI